MITLKLRPLSVNEAWQGRRFKTPEYTDYERDVGYLLPVHLRTAPPLGLLEVHYRFHFKNHKARDWDNPVKPLQDVLVKLGVIPDDRHIYRAVVEKVPDKEDFVEIDILPYTTTMPTSKHDRM
jgi:Holliday junction resolvase RusA-like endonuclease